LLGAGDELFPADHGIELHDYRVDYPGGKMTIRTISTTIAGMNAGSVSLMVRRSRVIW
jgi:hypothetical protein